MPLLHEITKYALSTSAVLDVFGAVQMSRKGGVEWILLGFLLCSLGVLRLVALFFEDECAVFFLVSCWYETLVVCVCLYFDMVSLSLWQRVVSVNVFFVLLIFADVACNIDPRLFTLFYSQ